MSSANDTAHESGVPWDASSRILRYMAFSAQAVANEFIDIAGKGNLDPMKLQKLVYYAHGWHLAIENAPLIQQSFEAWQFGPVIPDLYQEFKVYGAGKVTDYATKLIHATNKRVAPRIPDDDTSRRSEAARCLIGDVWSVYGEYSAIKLSNATHKKGTPWANWYDPYKHHVVIPNDEIKRYFNSLLVEGGSSLGIPAHT